MLCNEVMEDVVASRRSMVNIIPGEALRCAGVNDATLQHLKQFLNTICLYVFSMLSHVVSFFFYTLYIFIRFKHVCTDFANITQLRTEGHADVRHDRWQDSSHSQRALDLLQYFITSSRHILGTSLALWFSLLRLRPPVGQDPHFHWEALPRSDSVPFHQY